MGTKDGKHSNSEGSALFRGAVSDAQPLKTRERHTPDNNPKSKPRGKARLPRRDQPAPPQETISSAPKTSSADLSDNMSFQRNNITRKTMRELRRGKYRIQEEIDLHGCTRPEAQELLVQAALQQPLPSALVKLHGLKGKSELQRRLRAAVSILLRGRIDDSLLQAFREPNS